MPGISLTIRAPPKRKNPLAPTVKKQEKHSIIRFPATNSNTNQQLYSYFIIIIFFSLDLTYWSRQTGNVVQVLDYREKHPNQEVLWLKFADWTKNWNLFLYNQAIFLGITRIMSLMDF